MAATAEKVLDGAEIVRQVISLSRGTLAIWFIGEKQSGEKQFVLGLFGQDQEEWEVHVSIAHGFRSEHLKTGIFKPDITIGASPEDYLHAILEDLNSRVVTDGTIVGNGERSVVAAGQAINYRFRIDRDAKKIFIGTFFSPEH